MVTENNPKLCRINSIIQHSQESAENTCSMELSSPQFVSAVPVLTQADNDEQLISLWTHGKSKHTQRYYRKDVESFFAFAKKRLKAVILADLQQFADSLSNADLVDGSKRRILSSVKSLISFAHKLGYLPYDISKPLILPTPKDTLAERILSEDEIHRIIEAPQISPRDRLILKLLYVSAVRVSEMSNLKWRDTQERSDGGQLNVFGKGSKTRTVLLPSSIWQELQLHRNGAGDDAPIFRSRKGGHISPSQLLRIAKKAAEKAGLNKNVCCHGFRHSHASHAIENHAPIHLVQATLGHASISTTGKYLHARPQDSSSKYLDV